MRWMKAVHKTKEKMTTAKKKKGSKHKIYQTSDQSLVFGSSSRFWVLSSV